MGISPHQIAAAWRQERPETSTRSITVVSAIKRAARQLQRERERVLHELGVDAATLDLLSTLRRSGPGYTLSTRELAEQTLVSAGAISQRIARAERSDLVRRRPAEQGRTVLVALTPAGRALVERVVDKVLEADDGAIQSLTDDELELLQDLLAKLRL
ncbi:MarR family winged helix-turn-helix transcriptional regulator [Demequina muriae]|uniref:MarR family transcriptional regulator n=1 Tax=Demequina muriae TaxID=3051664 RepID=A0ABT8GEF7_9MICO|nr:MarR family transcriptional regulator [Demequina sp. EGI L300058]MDN4479818.1 MarR family transcriptional regulator [Demequina sp. EGI L300058]